jgi:hypothetical protein
MKLEPIPSPAGGHFRSIVLVPSLVIPVCAGMTG